MSENYILWSSQLKQKMGLIYHEEYTGCRSSLLS